MGKVSRVGNMGRAESVRMLGNKDGGGEEGDQKGD